MLSGQHRVYLHRSDLDEEILKPGKEYPFYFGETLRITEQQGDVEDRTLGKKVTGCCCCC